MTGIVAIGLNLNSASSNDRNHSMHLRRYHLFLVLFLHAIAIEYVARGRRCVCNVCLSTSGVIRIDRLIRVKFLSYYQALKPDHKTDSIFPIPKNNFFSHISFKISLSHFIRNIP